MESGFQLLSPGLSGSVKAAVWPQEIMDASTRMDLAFPLEVTHVAGKPRASKPNTVCS